MPRKTRIVVFTALAAVLLVSVSFIACNRIFSRELSYETTNKQVESTDGYADTLKLQSVLRSIAKNLSPAVVSINVEGEQVVQNPYSGMLEDPFFKRFFGDQDPFGGPREFKRKVQASGSGVIITKDGYLFSNNHVVDGAKKITVTLADGRTFDAKVVGTDRETDVALLKINADNLPVAPLGDSDSVEVGDLAVAIGNPFALNGTFTFGVVSAIKRSGISGFQKLIQTDAAVNPGNSGGPLINIRGQVIGINSMIHTTSGGYEGISFAVPINTARQIADQIAGNGKVSRGYLGISIGAVDAATRKILGLSENEGVTVSKVETNGPAAKAGVKSGDIITKVNGKSVNSPDDLQAVVGNLAPKTGVKLQILRGSARLEVTAVLAERPGNIGSADEDNGGKNDNGDQADQSFEFLGGVFVNATPDVLQKNGAESGVLVTQIKEDSLLSGVLEPGIVVNAINGTSVKDLDTLKKFAEANKDRKNYTFLCTKDGFVFYRGFEK